MTGGGGGGVKNKGEGYKMPQNSMTSFMDDPNCLFTFMKSFTFK